MSSNDRIILDQVLEQKRTTLGQNLNPNEYFELFVAEQVLKDFDLSYDELETGLVGNGGNGGVDGVYVFVNGELVQEDTDVSSLKKNVRLDLYIIQAKISESFGESSINKLHAVTTDLLDLSKPVDSFASVYNEPLRSAIGNFRRAYQELVHGHMDH